MLFRHLTKIRLKLLWITQPHNGTYHGKLFILKEDYWDVFPFGATNYKPVN